MRKFFGKKNFFSSIVSITLSLAFVASVTFAATTISTNIQTDGTLSVTGASTFTGTGIFNGQLQASSTALFGAGVTAYSTLSVTGLTTLGFASTSALSLNGTTANLMVNGLATTTASSGNITTQGNIGVGTTSPSLELSAQGSATTTLAAFATAPKGGCIQIQGTNGTLYRMYINGAAGMEEATTTPSGKVGFVAIWEAGSCK